VDQEQYRLIDEARPDPALQKDIELVKTILNKYPTAPLSGPMYERYMKSKATKRELWDRMREKILSRQEKEQGFKLLFDGKSMDQWRNYKSETIRPQWQIIDGAMVMTTKGGRDLITREKFGYFDLRLEYTIAEKGNSGIMFRVVEETEERNPWRLAPEYQLYDSFNVKVRGNRCAGALYGLIGAPNDLARKPGQWNQVRILLEPAGDNKGRLRFWLNDKQTVDIIIDPAPDSQWPILHESKKAEGHFAEDFFSARTGPILLQDHGKPVWFRNIRIKPLGK